MTTLNRRAFLRNSVAVAVSSSTLAMSTGAIANRLPDERLKSFLQSGERSIAGIRLRHKDMLASIYAERGFSPLWSMHGQYTDTSRAILRKLEDAPLLGLPSARYYTQVLSSWLPIQEPLTASNFELVLTDALIEYFDNLANDQTGEKPGDSRSWFANQVMAKTDNDARRFFRGEASFSETINRIQPRSHHYINLLVALREHHNILSQGGYLTIANGATLQPGVQDPRVRQLSQRLAQSGDYPGGYSPNSDFFDSAIEEALKAFQKRHGLEADGVMGSKTLAELNTPIEARIAQIEVNLDRWRWLPGDLGDNHIVVNTAGFQMEVVLNGHKALDMDVIVGKTKHKTPVFSDELEHLVFNPSWNVPKSIASKKLLPKELQNPGYLQSENFVAVSHSGKGTRSINSFDSTELEPANFTAQYRLQQRPGSNNALGTVKFMFPNKYAIYLHDTNSKSLFEKTTRAFSHGCVRVQDPVKLAKTLLGNNGHSEHSVDARFATDQSKTIRLDSPVPVHMTYQTAFVDQFGTLNFRNDIYGHDAYAIQRYQNQRPSLVRTERQLMAQLGGFASADI